MLGSAWPGGVVATLVSKGQAGLPGRPSSGTARRGKPGPACNLPPQGQPATQGRLQGRPAPVCLVPALLPTSRRASATCRSHGLSRLKIKTVGPLGPAEVGCSGKSERPAEAVSTPARAPGLAHLPGAWEGRAGLSHSEPLPLVCLSAPQDLPWPGLQRPRRGMHCPAQCPVGPRQCSPLPAACMARFWPPEPGVGRCLQDPAKASVLHSHRPGRNVPGPSCATIGYPAPGSDPHVPPPSLSPPLLLPQAGAAHLGAPRGRWECAGLSQAGGLEGFPGVVRGRGPGGPERQGASRGAGGGWVEGRQTPACLCCERVSRAGVTGEACGRSSRRPRWARAEREEGLPGLRGRRVRGGRPRPLIRGTNTR